MQAVAFVDRRGGVAMPDAILRTVFAVGVSVGGCRALWAIREANTLLPFGAVASPHTLIVNIDRTIPPTLVPAPHPTSHIGPPTINNP